MEDDMDGYLAKPSWTPPLEVPEPGELDSLADSLSIESSMSEQPRRESASQIDEFFTAAVRRRSSFMAILTALRGMEEDELLVKPEPAGGADQPAVTADEVMALLQYDRALSGGCAPSAKDEASRGPQLPGAFPSPPPPPQTLPSPPMPPTSEGYPGRYCLPPTPPMSDSGSPPPPPPPPYGRGPPPVWMAQQLLGDPRHLMGDPRHLMGDPRHLMGDPRHLMGDLRQQPESPSAERRRYNRRNNPELEKRRVHRCHFVGKWRTDRAGTATAVARRAVGFTG